MSTSTTTFRRFPGTLVLVGVAIATAAPAALAGHQDLGTEAALQQIQGGRLNEGTAAPAGARAQSAHETSDALERFLRNDRRHVRPDDHGGARGIGAQTSVADPSDVVSRYLRRNPTPDHAAVGPPSTSLPALHESVGRPSTFDWRDAGIGAGGALATILIALGSMMILLRRKTSDTRMLSS